MITVRLARHAMATRFEIVLCGSNPVSLRAAGEEALAEIERLEAQLSLFKPASEIARVNAGAAYEPVRVSPPVFQLLQHARKLTQETDGAFDVTIAPLMRCWGFLDGSGDRPDPSQVTAARECVGMGKVHLDELSCTVSFERPGMMIDLGAIGKGYAIDRAIELLQEAGVENLLIHGGTSTAYALGCPPDAPSWQIEIPSPLTMKQRTVEKISPHPPALVGAPDEAASAQLASKPFAVVRLQNCSLSVSAVWGKFFRSEGRTFGHIIDPRTGEPAVHALLSAVVCSSATETDALSTALLTLGPEGHDRIAGLRSEIKTLVVSGEGESYQVRSQGIPTEALA
jgi:FAD:protein FMN transferase